jgi:hypothetical protein
MRGRDVGELLRDYQEALGRKRELPKELVGRLEDYQRFIRTRSNVLRRDPAQLFAQGAAQPGDSAAGKDFRRLAKEGQGPERPWFRLRNVPETDPQRHQLLTIEVGAYVNAVAWLMREGRPHALVGCRDGMLRLYDLAINQLVREYPGHGGGVLAVALSSDGRHALSGSGDETLRWWDLNSGRCLTVFPCGEPVASAAVHWCPSDQRHRVAVGLADGQVQFFRIEVP